jgi:hypothetical protein
MSRRKGAALISALLTSLVGTCCSAQESTVLVALPTKYVQELVAKCRLGTEDPRLCKVLADQSRASRKPLPPTETVPPTTSTSNTRAAERAGSAESPAQKRLFIRADPIDNFWYGLTPNGDVSGAKGASISYTEDQLANTKTANINGMVSYLVLPGTPRDWGATALSVWTSGNGSWNDPPKKVDNSALRVGATGQLRLITAAPDETAKITNLLFSVSPYLQTDFRGHERAGGVNLAVEPIWPGIFLGAGKAVQDYFLFYWVARPEIDYLQVTDRGNSNLPKGSHVWVGGVARAYLYLFPFSSFHQWDPWLVNRFTLIGTAKYYSDTNSDLLARLYSAELQYNLASCTPKVTSPDEYADCKIPGGSSISFEYNWGIDRETLVKAHKYMVKLNYKY